MSLYDAIEEAGAPARRGIGGVVTGIVTNTDDPEGHGRVRVKLPWLSETDESAWARVATPLGGVSFRPEPHDEVLVAFEHGDVSRPVVIGGLWTGADDPPEPEGTRVLVRTIRSRGGHLIRLTCEDGKETIEIVDKTEKNRIVIDTAANTVTIASGADVVIAAPQGTITLDAKHIRLTSSDAASVTSGGALTLEGRTVDIN